MAPPLPVDRNAVQLDARERETTVEESKTRSITQAARLLGTDANDPVVQLVLNKFWDEAFEAGRLNALDELQDRFCVCMK